ncbi:uncharacterized protein SCHCODRAFT_02533965 [Schizophyllum commune H4-8]|nr:uncharacterized protein SCHCODRAFT_02533965 [Schizophyllum commune H4-8]KAI5897092.1 hypothetical protein SCHCODRAFT_02533965 [Schizophyllum commune H4-8]
MAFLTSSQSTLPEKFKRVIQAPFRSPIPGRDRMNDLENVGDGVMRPDRVYVSILRDLDHGLKEQQRTHSAVKDSIAAPENLIGSPRSSMSEEDIESKPPQTNWRVGGPKFVNELADEDIAWREGTQLVDHLDSTTCRVARENIDTLLVFAGLFSGVATAFIIESYRWLLQEPDDMSAEYLRRILGVLTNSTIPAIPQSSGRPSLPDDIVALINGLWFSSLTLSLSSALLGIVSKQWLHEYLRDAGRSQMTNLAVRQVKYQGFTRWSVEFIITLIPLLLQGALFVFLTGVVYLLWHIQPVIAAVVSALALFIVIFFIVTTVLPALQFMLGWAGHLRMHTTNQFPFKSAQALIFLRISIFIANSLAWIHHYFISMKGFHFGYTSFHAPFPSYSAWPQLDLDWTRLRDQSARQNDEPTSIGLFVGYMELNFEHRLLRDWIWGCLWSLRDYAADAKYVLQCIRRKPDIKSDFPSVEDHLAKEVIPLLSGRLASQATSELVMLSLLGSANKGPHGEARIEHLIRLFNSLIYRDAGRVPMSVYDTLQATLQETVHEPLGSGKHIFSASILRKSQHAEDLFDSPFLDLVTVIVTCLSGGEVPEDSDVWIMNRDLSLDLCSDVTEWLERYPDPSSNWEDYKARVIWSAHITVLLARILAGFKNIEPANLQKTHRRFPAIFELSRLVYERALSIPVDVLPTWVPDKSDMEEFARVKVAIEEVAQRGPDIAIIVQAKHTTNGPTRHGVHWDDQNGSAPAETSSQINDMDTPDTNPVASGAEGGSMSPESALTERSASAPAS